MPTWTQEQLNAYEARRAKIHTLIEHPVPYEPMAENEGKAGDAKGVLTCVKITSFRRRLLDWDNLAGGAKYFCDCCTYAGLIHGDAPDQIALQISQVKVKTKHEERTEIEIL